MMKKYLSVLYGAKGKGMECLHISKKLKPIQREIEERFLSLIVSEEDENGYIYDHWGMSIVLGKISRCKESVYDNRPTQVLHLYFMDEKDLTQVHNWYCQNWKIDFINVTDFTRNPEEMIMVESSAPEEQLLHTLSATKLKHLFYNMMDVFSRPDKVRITNDLCSSDEIFTYLMKMYDFSAVKKEQILCGCQSYYGESYNYKKGKIVICKSFFMGEETETLQQLSITRTETYEQYAYLFEFYRHDMQTRKTMYSLEKYMRVCDVYKNGKFATARDLLEVECAKCKGIKRRRIKKVMRMLKGLDKKR